MIELNLTNLEDLARGTAFLATGGGGDPYIGKLMLKHQLEQGKKVKIIRSNKNNKKTYNIDLTEANIMTSDFFYLKNNDLIYIQPLKYKGFRKSQSQTLLSVLTTVAILFNVYLKATE